MVEKTKSEKFDIRHELAIERTILSNQRTLLAYVRTALTLFIPGLSFYHFSDDRLLRSIGLAFLPIGASILLFGLYKFFIMKRRIKADLSLVKKHDNTST